ncbi:MAG TPA: Calx-beta domain-containing protein [Thermoanaerobaculia bacterium]|jgi:plastocyanin|nr:Calx-beta domain-containing protein [Thermoanaerobaculia bacterium]
MTIQRVTLPVLALGFLLAASALGQPHHAAGTMGTKIYDPEPHGGDPSTPEGCAGVVAKITIHDMSFSPASVTVDPGQPVCWTWSGSLPHTVKADDASFSSGNPAESNTFQHTYSAPGTYGFYCQVHGSLTGGMRGQVIVRGESPGNSGGQGPGTLGFATPTYEVSEAAGAVTLTVERAGGSDGAATVKFAVAQGTAKSGKDFIARSGTLKWANGDQAPKTIDVAIKNDSAREPDESFSVKLSKATGAALGVSIATVTIHDDDGTGCGASSTAASQLRATGQSGSEIRLTWEGASTEAKSFHIERRSLGGTFQEIAAVEAGVESFTDSGLPGGADFQYRVRTEAADGSSAVSEIAAAATNGLTTPCDDSGRSLCLGGGRFEATVAGGRETKQMVLPEAGNSGLFALSSSQDLQLLLNVHDGCAANNHYWLDLAAVTAAAEAEFTVRVRDTQTGRTWVYVHPAGSAPAPLRDVEAFATCP